MIEEKLVQMKKEIKIMIIGKLDNPKIECLKTLLHEESNSMMIPLCVKANVAT